MVAPAGAIATRSGRLVVSVALRTGNFGGAESSTSAIFGGAGGSVSISGGAGGSSGSGNAELPSGSGSGEGLTAIVRWTFVAGGNSAATAGDRTAATVGAGASFLRVGLRSEERRVGKEC